MTKRYFLLFINLLIFPVLASSQHIIWDVSFATKFDNHEFMQMSVGESKTLFGAFLTPVAGFQWDEGKHTLVAGGDVVRYFGDYVTPYQWDLQFYYRFKNKNFDVFAGAFPQKDSYSDFSTAFINDTKRFRETVIEGFKFKYSNDYGNVSLIFTWPRRDHEWMSETMTVFSTSKFHYKWLYAGYLFDMNHYAYDIAAKNVVDNIWVNPFIGVSFDKYVPLQVLDLRIGWILTVQKDRWITDDFIYPAGGAVDFTIQKWGVGLHNSFYFGDNLMPYFNNYNSSGDIYGNELYYGDVMYSTDSGIYNRLEAYWRAYSNDYINVNVNVVMHLDGYGKMGWQQGASVSVNMNNFSWKKLAAKHNSNNN